MLDGFLGSRCMIAWLKSGGGGVGVAESMSWTMRRKMGCDRFLKGLYARNGIPLGPGDEDG